MYHLKGPAFWCYGGENMFSGLEIICLFIHFYKAFHRIYITLALNIFLTKFGTGIFLRKIFPPTPWKSIGHLISQLLYSLKQIKTFLHLANCISTRKVVSRFMLMHIFKEKFRFLKCLSVTKAGYKKRHCPHSLFRRVFCILDSLTWTFEWIFEWKSVLFMSHP